MIFFFFFTGGSVTCTSITVSCDTEGSVTGSLLHLHVLLVILSLGLLLISHFTAGLVCFTSGSTTTLFLFIYFYFTVHGTTVILTYVTNRSVTGRFVTVASVTAGFVTSCLSVLYLLQLYWLVLQVFVLFFTAGSVIGSSATLPPLPSLCY